jgi:hypothetical protein
LAHKFDPKAVEIIATDADNTIGWMANVFVQVRTGRMTIDSVKRLESAARLLRVRSSGPVGAIAVLESTADVVPSGVREAQRDAVTSLMQDPRTFMTATIAGEGVKATLLRSVSRFVAPKMPRVHTAPNLFHATEWLAKSLGGEHSASELLALVEHVRAVAKESAAAK